MENKANGVRTAVDLAGNGLRYAGQLSSAVLRVLLQVGENYFCCSMGMAESISRSSRLEERSQTIAFNYKRQLGKSKEGITGYLYRTLRKSWKALNTSECREVNSHVSVKIL